MTPAEPQRFTPEQLRAIRARDGELFLDAGAGSGKTSVLVERFVRAVVEDGVPVGAILTITFTEKAAAQMRDRIRARLLQAGAATAVSATEGAFISTIHGFCARVLRAHALAAGLDPAFTVLDELEAGRLADAAFDRALTELAGERPGGVELVAAYGAGELRAAIQAIHRQLRSRGQRRPRLPALRPEPFDLEAAARELVRAAARVRAELSAIAAPSVRVLEALERLARVEELVGGALTGGELAVGELAVGAVAVGALAGAAGPGGAVPGGGLPGGFGSGGGLPGAAGPGGPLPRSAGPGGAVPGGEGGPPFAGGDGGLPGLGGRMPWPEDLDRLRLPGGNGAALSTAACAEYESALARLRAGCEAGWAQPTLALLDQLLVGFGEHYERAKRERSGLDFEDLELLCCELLRDPELRDTYRRRFARVMVDELQDTNPVQLELIEAVSEENLFTVGDAQQSIYGFRHADVELFEARGRRLEGCGRRVRLRANFRSRPEILAVVNRVFARELGDGFVRLVAGRRAQVPADVERAPQNGDGEGAPRDEQGGEGAPRHEQGGEGAPRVELIVADRGGEWTPEGPAAAWRVAEARALAGRVHELVDEGFRPGQIVVLLRASTDMRAYERALEERGIPTYTVGGRGYWSHPQVLDMVAYLRVLANPRDEQALYAVLASPLVGASLDALVLLASAARAADRDPWTVLRERPEELAELPAPERERLVAAAGWLADERQGTARRGAEELLDRALERTGYDLFVLALPGGRRRLANVRKLMRLGRQHLAEHGPRLHEFVELIRQRAEGWRPDPDQGEAPIEGEALDAVRLMTIHRAKGLEFDVVCVADLGRGARNRGELLRVGADGRLGLRLARPGGGGRVAALDHEALADEQRRRAAAEERRLLYVAMTRARERLILSGGAKVEAWGAPSRAGGPITWLGPALVGDIAAGAGVSEGVAFRVVRPGEGAGKADAAAAAGEPARASDAAAAAGEPARGPDPAAGAAGEPACGPDTAAAGPDLSPPGPPVPERAERSGGPVIRTLSYSAIAAHQRCGYRFYLERVLGLPPVEEGEAAPSAGEGGAAALSAAERGTLVHALLERLDFRRPLIPSPAAILAAAPRPLGAAELEEVAALVERFAASEVCRRLARATWIRREQRFAFPLRGALVSGTLDVIAGEPQARHLIVDYKTDRLGEAEPATVVEREYGAQRLIYALAALEAGASEVEVAHVFLEAPERPVWSRCTREQAAALRSRLAELAGGLLQGGEFPVSDTPHRRLCHGCPGEGGLCAWPLEVTRRVSPEQLF